MRSQLVVAVFAVICLKLADFALLGGPSNKDMIINAGYTKILYDKLASECPSYLTSTREVININHEAFTEIQHEFFNNLFKKLIECRKTRSITTLKPQTTQKNAQTTATKSFVTTIKPTIVMTTSLITKKKPPTTKKQTTKPTTSTIIKQTTPTTVKWTTRRSTKPTNTTLAKEAISTGEKPTTQTATTTYYSTPRSAKKLSTIPNHGEETMMVQILNQEVRSPGQDIHVTSMLTSHNGSGLQGQLVTGC